MYILNFAVTLYTLQLDAHTVVPFLYGPPHHRPPGLYGHIFIRPEDHTQQHGGFVYTRNELLRLRPPPHPPLMPTVNTTQDASKKRKRGRRGGVKNRLRRRPAKPPLPSVVFANVQSLYNKIDELHAKCRYDNVYREACVMAFCETWLDSTRPDDDIILDGFTVYRSDRTKESGKT